MLHFSIKNRFVILLLVIILLLYWTLCRKGHEILTF